MTERLKGVLPLAAVIGVLAFFYVEFTLNFTFQWFTDGDLGNGLGLPSNFYLIAPAGFVSWGFYFAAGAGMEGVKKVAASSVVGSVAALIVMALGPETADLPDFWGISLWVGITAFLAVMVVAGGDWYYVPAAFGAYASVIFWWFATGLDNWAPDGGGIGNSIEALGDPATAGAGAFGGVLSTPYGWVWFNILITLFLGILMGYLSSTITAAITPKPAEEATEEATEE
jgi:hypothetical protein